MPNNRNENDRFGLGFFLGLAAGAAAAWWLQTDEGKEFRKNTATRVNDYSSKMAESANEYGSKFKESASNQWSNLREGANVAIERGRHYADNMRSSVKETIDRVSTRAGDEVDDAESAFKRGAKSAKKKIDAAAAQLESIVENGKK